MNSDITVPERLEVEKNARLSGEFRTSVSNSIAKLKEISSQSLSIKTQGKWDSFWHKSENIKILAGNVGEVVTIQQKTFDLIMFLFAISGAMKQEYDLVLQSISEIQNNATDGELLSNLLTVKKAVVEMKTKQEMIDSLVTFSNDLRDSLEELNRSLASLSHDYAHWKNAFSQQCQSLREKQEEEGSQFRRLLRSLDLSNQQRLNELQTAFKQAAASSAPTPRPLSPPRNNRQWLLPGIAILLSLVAIGVHFIP
jgi:hypothetical protein